MHPWAAHGDDEGGKETVDDDDEDRQDEGPPPRGPQHRRAPLPLAAAIEHFPPRGPELAEHAVVVGEDAEGPSMYDVTQMFHSFWTSPPLVTVPFTQPTITIFTF